MVKVSNPSKLRILAMALIISVVMILGPTKQADAYVSGEAGLVFLVVAAAATYATVMGVACAPIAAVKGEDYPGGFSAAYGDCFSLEMKNTTPTDESSDASDQLVEEEDEDRYRDSD